MGTRPYNCPECCIPPKIKHEACLQTTLKLRRKKTVHISCPECGKRTADYDELEYAIEDWNKWVAYITTIRKVLKNEN